LARIGCWLRSRTFSTRSTPFGIEELGPTDKGQRTKHTDCQNNRSCVQRLSASKREADRAGQTGQDAGRALNAFRHQRGTRNRRLVGLGHGLLALNAFRHQRGRRTADASAPSAVESLCSTPFGIKEEGAKSSTIAGVGLPTCSTPFGVKEEGGPPRLGDARGVEGVLNAFRHQRAG